MFYIKWGKILVFSKELLFLRECPHENRSESFAITSSECMDDWEELFWVTTEGQYISVVSTTTKVTLNTTPWEKFFNLKSSSVFRVWTLKYEIKSFSKSTFQFPSAATANPTHHFSGYGSLGISPNLMPGSSTPEQFQVAKPRMRICFDPETEIPRLQKWFAENNHPTRQQVCVINLIFCFPWRPLLVMYRIHFRHFLASFKVCRVSITNRHCKQQMTRVRRYCSKKRELQIHLFVRR